MPILLNEKGTINVVPVVRTSKWFSYDQLKKIIKPYHFQTLKQYEEYVKGNNMRSNGWPLHVSSTYGTEYKGVEDFLSLPPGTLRQYRMNNVRRAWEAKRNRPKGLPYKKRSEVVVTSKTPISNNSLTMQEVCSFLVNKGMVNTVEHILKENKLTLKDSIEINKSLLSYYKEKQTVKA